jgi:hypothetical protein
MISYQYQNSVGIEGGGKRGGRTSNEGNAEEKKDDAGSLDDGGVERKWRVFPPYYRGKN